MLTDWRSQGDYKQRDIMIMWPSEFLLTFSPGYCFFSNNFDHLVLASLKIFLLDYCDWIWNLGKHCIAVLWFHYYLLLKMREFGHSGTCLQLHQLRGRNVHWPLWDQGWSDQYWKFQTSQWNLVWPFLKTKTKIDISSSSKELIWKTHKSFLKLRSKIISIWGLWYYI